MNTFRPDRDQQAQTLTSHPRNKIIAKTQEPQINAAALVGNLFYAVLVVGLMGYFFDRMMQALK